jgi:hypothetical protein
MWWVSLVWAGGIDRVPEDFDTLQRAVDEGRGSVIELAAGRHAGAVVDRSVVIRGVAGAVIDQGVEAGRLTPGLWLVDGADGVVVQGLIFDGDGALDAGVYSSVARGGVVDGVQLLGNRFERCVQAVTVVGDAAGWSIVGNRFDGLGAGPLRGGEGGGIGVYARQAEGLVVLDNLFVGWVPELGFATAGVALRDCDSCSVVGNRFAMRGGEGRHGAVVDALGGGDAGGSQELVLADNDAGEDAAGWSGVSFWVGGEGVLVEGNVGEVWALDR